MALIRLDRLPLDILVQIAGLLGPLDVLSLRLTSRALFTASNESHLPRHPGPVPSQSRQDLEDAVTRSAIVEHRMISQMDPKKVRKIALDIDEQGKARLLAGRWLVSKSYNKVLCRDLDSAQGGESQVVYEVFQPWNLKFVTTAEIVDCEGRYHGCIALSERKYRPLKDQVTILKVKPTGQTIELIKISCFDIPGISFTLDYTGTEVELTIGPSALVVWWEQVVSDPGEENNHLRRYAVIDFSNVWQIPVVRTTLDYTEYFPRLANWSTLSAGLRTILRPDVHGNTLRRFLDSSNRDDDSDDGTRTLIYLIPLASALSGECKPRLLGWSEAAVTLPVLLRDSTLTADGNTSIALAGLCHDPYSVRKTYVFTMRLSIPPAEEQHFTPPWFEVQTNIGPSVSCLSMLAHPVLNGSLRILFSYLEAEEGHRHLCLGAMSIDPKEPDYDIMWQKSPTMRIGGDTDAVRGKNVVEDVNLLRGRVCLYEEAEYEEGEVRRERIILDFS
ncbi:hypothetical protein CONPUDRAFT_74986 [Coniophora puteana RWD-64-598 SS2]|uniref:Uncharacterized protein n=1 Tax=Coniophora puteana (strain RWD-64-598) TaxID=741705 RepID=A0A5M3MG75_CONPW|nr:uncharacterized protein CONPUDRAFT_74986 [Coniophora puteana RWD-64-598 SS2]EIW78249.1 hypothetical protein CONPUDRAFT_74986 [Coniophora puteana RWD-64-598 SS2]